MSTEKVTINEVVESLTGFDEIAIEKHFNGFDIYNDSQTRSVRAMRALAFVQFTRQGMTAVQALRTAQEMPFKEISDLFLDEEPEVDPEEPETASGKDASHAA